MAKKEVVEEKVDYQMVNLDDSELGIQDELPTVIEDIPVKTIREKKAKVNHYDDEPISCLRNEKVFIRHIPKEGGMVNNPKHILYGGMAENAVRYFTVPKLSSGMYVNVLTDSEKEFLEQIMGLEYNALSIYKKVDNYWENNMVRLTKQDNILDLSDPEDYIRYKILLANKNFIAPSLEMLNDYPKATYQFVIIAEGEETKTAKDNMSVTMKCYKEFGKIENDVNTLRMVVETIDGRPTSPNVKLEFLQTKINTLIQADSKLFLKTIEDPYLPTKVLIKRAVEGGLISNRGNYLYLKQDNSPLCENDQEPTLSTAAKYLNNPKHQELKLMLEAKLK